MALRTIQINGEDIYMPNDFQPEREHVYAAEYTTCTGKIIADVIGWRYADMELNWGTLPQSMLQVLTGMSGVCTMTFKDVNGLTVTEEIRPMSQVFIGTRMLGYDGEPLWRDVKLGVSFINVHN